MLMSQTVYADDSAEDDKVDDDDDATTHGVQILFLFLGIATKSPRARSTAAIHPWAYAAVPSVLTALAHGLIQPIHLPPQL